MNEETDKLLKEIKAYRNDMVARNYPFQQISDIITKWEMKIKGIIGDEVKGKDVKDFLEEAIKEEKELNDSYKESVRQTKERKTTSEKLQNELEPINSPMSDD